MFKQYKLGKVNQDRLFGHLPTAIRSVLLTKPMMGSVVLGGGAIRSSFSKEYPHDYDLFFLNQEYARNVELMLVNHHGYKVIFRCPLGELISLQCGPVKIQLILKRTYSSIEEMLNSFDFTVTQFATVDCVTLWSNRQAIKDAKKKSLRVAAITYPVASLNRVQKYLRYGFIPCSDFYKSLAIAVADAMWLIKLQTEEEQAKSLALYVD